MYLVLHPCMCQSQHQSCVISPKATATLRLKTKQVFFHIQQVVVATICSHRSLAFNTLCLWTFSQFHYLWRNLRISVSNPSPYYLRWHVIANWTPFNRRLILTDVLSLSCHTPVCVSRLVFVRFLHVSV